jgi:tRNA(Ser,Leu) C12 N-acetylase TAN1
LPGNLTQQRGLSETSRAVHRRRNRHAVVAAEKNQPHNPRVRRRNRDKTVPADWNVVVMTEPGMTGRVLNGLGRFGRFVPSPYPSVIVGRTHGDDALAEFVTLRSETPERFEHVRKIMPVEAVVPFERDDVTETLCTALDGQGGRLANKPFYVRARLRGMKGRLETQAVERALGAFLLDAAERAGGAASVRFDDPDVVVVAEVVGKTVGWAFLERERRDPDLLRAR